MAASVTEQILAQVLVALNNTTSAAANVFRERDDAFGDGDGKALNIKRSETTGMEFGDSGQQQLVGFDVEIHAAGANPLTLADALHMEVHAKLFADAGLAALGKGLRCMGTDAETETRDRPVAKLTAHYRLKVFVRPGDLTRAIT